jgi:hypothetical protein
MRRRFDRFCDRRRRLSLASIKIQRDVLNLLMSAPWRSAAGVNSATTPGAPAVRSCAPCTAIWAGEDRAEIRGCAAKPGAASDLRANALVRLVGDARGRARCCARMHARCATNSAVPVEKHVRRRLRRIAESLSTLTGIEAPPAARR